MRTTTHLLVLTCLAACGVPERTEGVTGEDIAKAWEQQDDPDILADDLVYTWSELPSKGQATEVPWAANYWPTYRDSINDRWAGSEILSPGEKFQEAFHLPGLTDAISAEYGIDSQTHRTACTESSACDSAKGETCAIRVGATEGRCVETWFGICHAWAPAAILEREPVKPVTFNGVTFSVNDLKALVTLSYDEQVSVKFLSLRCNRRLGDAPEGSEDDDSWGALGDFGIPEDDACNDTNAGAFHVVVTNFLGLRGQSLVEDRTIDYEVWNQPLRGFTVTQDEAVDAATANRLIGVDDGATEYRFNDAAVAFRHVKMGLEWIAESPRDVDGHLAGRIDAFTHTDRYEYVVELDADDKVIGGEWVGDSKTAHPDFLWLPYDKGATEVAQVTKGTAHTGIKWHDVQLLLAQSLEGTDDAGPGGFDWGGACDSGSGAFTQFIPHDDTVVVGDIPEAKADVRIDLRAIEDVDVQLIDVQTGDLIVAWPDGLLADEEEGCTPYEGMEICYSGYNGVNGALGTEWIEIRGETTRTLTMRAYGYAAGNADITYTWRAPEGCVDQGKGSFEQAIEEGGVVNVGIIPAGKTDVSIALTSEEDVDVQLFDGAIPLVQWPDGKLSGAKSQTLEYEGVTITWSGYNGGQSKRTLGHETITIQGTLSRDLTMRAYGYAAGTAKVEYAWGTELR